MLKNRLFFIVDILKLQSTAKSEKILPGSVRPCQETEQLDFPRKCLNTVKSRTVLTTIGIWHLHFITLLLESHFTQAIMLKRKINCIRFKRPNLPLSQLHYVFLHKFHKLYNFKKKLTEIPVVIVRDIYKTLVLLKYDKYCCLIAWLYVVLFLFNQTCQCIIAFNPWTIPTFNALKNENILLLIVFPFISWIGDLPIFNFMNTISLEQHC